jgi:acyl carrier protein
MNSNHIVERVLALAAQIAGPERTPPQVGPDTQLAEGGLWLDSAELLEMIVACEAEFAVEFDSEADLTTEALGSIGSLAAVIERKLSR